MTSLQNRISFGDSAFRGWSGLKGPWNHLTEFGFFLEVSEFKCISWNQKWKGSEKQRGNSHLKFADTTLFTQWGVSAIKGQGLRQGAQESSCCHLQLDIKGWRWSKWWCDLQREEWTDWKRVALSDGQGMRVSIRVPKFHNSFTTSCDQMWYSVYTTWCTV